MQIPCSMLYHSIKGSLSALTKHNESQIANQIILQHLDPSGEWVLKLRYIEIDTSTFHTKVGHQKCEDR